MSKRIAPMTVLSACIALLLFASYGCSSQIETPKELTLDLGQGVQMQLVLIPAGDFLMGPNVPDQEGKILARKVTISKPFYMAKYPTTQQQWQALMPKNPSKFKGADNPVDSIQWKAAQDFCAKLAAKTGKPVRLPTEAEWEYACRAGTTTDYYFGDDPNALPDYAWYEDNSNDTTHHVGQKKPNAWGLYDMCGNVWEWCNDFYIPIDYTAGPATNPKGPEKGNHLSYGDSHVLRGGAWHTEPGYSRSGSRGGNFPCGEGGPASWSNASRSGFRIVVTAYKTP